MERLREAEGDPDLGGQLGHPRRRQVEADAERLEDVGGPRGRGRRPVAVLDDPARRPPATTSAAIVEMLTVCAPVAAGADDVDRLGPGTSIRMACASIVSASPRSSSTVSPLARSATRKPASWTGGGVAAHDLVHRPRGLARARSCAGEQRGEAGPARWLARAGGR